MLFPALLLSQVFQVYWSSCLTPSIGVLAILGGFHVLNECHSDQTGKPKLGHLHVSHNIAEHTILNKSSKYRNLLDIYGNTDLSPIKGFNYYNLENSLMHRLGRNKSHTKLFIKKIKSNNAIKLVEIHNRPLSVIAVKKKLPKMKIIFYYHNDPLSMKGYISSEKRKKILA